MYLDRDGNVVRGLSTKGYLAVGVPGNVAGLRAGARQVRHDEARAPSSRRRSASRSAASCWSRATSTCWPPPPRISAPTRRRPRSSSTRASRSRPDSAWCRRTSRARCGASRRNGADGFYKGPVADAIVAASTRGKGIITQADLDAVQGARAGADRVRLPRLPHRLGAAAELRRRDRLRDPEHPRRLSAAGAGLPLGAGRALPDRGDAPRVRGSQQLPRRPGLREATRSSACWTRATPRRSAPRSTRPGPAFPATSSPASRRTKAPTPRTTRSSTRPATRWRSPTR